MLDNRTPRSPGGGDGVPGKRLRRAIETMIGACGVVTRHTEAPWASITFAGARHTLELRFEGVAGVAGGEGFIEALPDHEFTLPGQIVADAAIVSVDHSLLPQPLMIVTCELLLLHDA
ncbi:MAG: hypothetical protein WA948_11025 [Pontixanthobacter sp.]